MIELTKELQHKIKRLQIASNQIADDVMAGVYQSAFKGSGIEFQEVREYQSGDDIRSIDWNVTARLGNLFIKRYKEERSLTVTLLVDISSSTNFGSANVLKKELIAEIASLIAFSAIKNEDKIALLLFSDQIELYIPPKKGLKHVLRIIRELLLFEPSHKGTNLSLALSYFSKIQHKKSIGFLFSDFLTNDLDYASSYVTKKHDLIAICVTDSLEKNFPLTGVVEIKDLETEKSELLSLRQDQIESYNSAFENLRESHKRLLLGKGVELIELDTNQPYMPILKSFFKRRGKR